MNNRARIPAGRPLWVLLALMAPLLAPAVPVAEPEAKPPAAPAEPGPAASDPRPVPRIQQPEPPAPPLGLRRNLPGPGAAPATEPRGRDCCSMEH